MLLIGIIASCITFMSFKNKQENRMIDRRNRLAEKQEELIEMLKKKNETENKEDNDN